MYIISTHIKIINSKFTHNNIDEWISVYQNSFDSSFFILTDVKLARLNRRQLSGYCTSTLDSVGYLNFEYLFYLLLLIVNLNPISDPIIPIKTEQYREKYIMQCLYLEKLFVFFFVRQRTMDELVIKAEHPVLKKCGCCHEEQKYRNQCFSAFK